MDADELQARLNAALDRAGQTTSVAERSRLIAQAAELQRRLSRMQAEQRVDRTARACE